MAKNLYCIPCGRVRREAYATVLIDDEPMCGRCAQSADRSAIRGTLAQQMVPMAETSEVRASGAIRGAAAAMKIAPAVTATAVKPLNRKARGSLMDVLVAVELGMADVPAGRGARHPQGRIGELWVKFQALESGRVLKVNCRDTQHAGCTDRELRKKAKAAGVGIASKRVGSDYWCWKDKA